VRYEAGSKLAGVIYIHRISDKRFAGISAPNFKISRELCGDTSLKNVVLVTNMCGGRGSQDVGEAHERELTANFFKPVLDKGAQLTHHRYIPKSAHDIQRIMENQPAPPRA